MKWLPFFASALSLYKSLPWILWIKSSQPFLVLYCLTQTEFCSHDLLKFLRCLSWAFNIGNAVILGPTPDLLNQNSGGGALRSVFKLTLPWFQCKVDLEKHLPRDTWQSCMVTSVASTLERALATPCHKLISSPGKGNQQTSLVTWLCCKYFRLNEKSQN